MSNLGLSKNTHRIWLTFLCRCQESGWSDISIKERIWIPTSNIYIYMYTYHHQKTSDIRPQQVRITPTKIGKHNNPFVSRMGFFCPSRCVTPCQTSTWGFSSAHRIWSWVCHDWVCHFPCDSPCGQIQRSWKTSRMAELKQYIRLE